MQHDRISANPRPGADREATQDFGAGTDDDAVFERRMALTAADRRTAQSDALIERHVVANHDAGPMVDEQPAADRRRRMDLDQRQEPRQIRYPTGDHEQPVSPEPVGDPVEYHRMKARIGERDLEARPRRWIEPQDRVDFLAQSLQHFGLRLIYDPLAWSGPAAESLSPHLVRCGGETISIPSITVNFRAVLLVGP